MYQYKPDLVIFLACTCNIYFYYLMPVFQVIVSEKAYYISSISNHIDHAILKSEDENFLKMIVFQKDKKRKSLLFSKSKLLLSISNQNINLTKWNQSILVAVLIILGFRHQNIETWSDYHSNRTTSGLARKWNGYDIRKKISVVLKIE